MPITKLFMPFLSVFYIYIVHLMVNALSNERVEENDKKYYLRYIVSYIIVVFFSTVIQKPIFNLFASYTAIFIILKNYCYDLVDKAFNALYIDTVLLIAEIVSGTFLGYAHIIPTRDIEIKQVADLIIMQAFSYIVALILAKVKKEKNNKIDDFTKYYLLTVPLLSLILLILFYSFEKIQPVQTSILTILLLLINVITYKVYINTVKIITFKKNKEVVEEQNNFYKNQLRLMKESEETIKSYRHDMKNHMTVINSLIDKDEIEALKKYLNEISNISFDNEKYISSGNEIIDSIVNYKLNLAENEKIRFITDISISTGLHISSYDMTIILGNILDNAIEASKKVDEVERKIILKIKEENSKFIIYIQNKFNGNLKNNYESTKDNEKEHGYGIKNIKKVVEKNNGICKFEIIDKSIFTTLIVFIIQ
ncbi:GHKL domain protein [Peptoanaerobacter stomatis]|uniref:GHKL domain protein n=1 Tax=Peptoanaerobacter stomatis TaxID=796937 RepID=J4W4Y7_9FIRM|nr:GHKL domain-containing protein [Peptoanaerobacter stomatis]EJU21081.1 GHKL domain protein [Peptoanaerobacter stomatis]NWO25399.1 GHKL domain-containing protein [Peptostreptococcaceae bacterium oral taxon 081]